MRKHTILLLITAILSLQSPLFAQKKSITIPEALTKIEKIYGSRFVYDASLFKTEPAVEFQLAGKSNEKVEDVLKSLLYPRGFVFLYIDRSHFAIIRDAQVKNANKSPVTGGEPNSSRKVSGLVTDTSGKAIEGATIIADGSRTATATDANGRFYFDIPRSLSSLSIFFIGAETVHLDIPEDGFVIVRMKLNARSLDQVTVVSTGLQQLPKERATGSFSVVTRQQIEETPTPNLLQRLQNQVPGLQLDFLSPDNTFAYPNNNSSDPETKSSVYTLKIRGNSTFSGDKYPLVVVDGFPAEIDIRSLNPNDIDQITVLKDAAAASIWGIRATNGVIVIQTKKGKFNQPPSVSFNTYYGFSRRPNLNQQNLITSPQMIDFEKELVEKNLVFDNSQFDFGVPASQAVNLLFQQQRGEITQAQLDASLQSLGASTNYDEFGRYFMSPASTQSYNLSVSGGGNAYSYFTSASYAREQTNLKGSATGRLTLTTNQTFKIFRTLEFASSLKLSSFNAGYNSIGTAALIDRSLPFMPYDHVVDASGKGIGYYRRFNKGFSEKLEQEGYLDYRTNYVDEQRLADNNVKETNLTGNFSLSKPLPFVKGLSATALYSIEKSFGNSRQFQNPYTFTARDFLNMATSYDNTTGIATLNVPYGGILSTQTNNRNNYSLRGQLAFNGDLDMRNTLNIIAGAEIRQTYDITDPGSRYGWNDQSQVSQYFPSTYNTIYGYEATLNPPLGYSDQKRRFLAYFSNAAYTLLDRYTLSGSVRYDDYNNFGLDVRYRAKPFWSTGVSWNVTREKFLEHQSWLNNLLFRVTYGLNGNIDRKAHPEATLSLQGIDAVNGLPTAYISSPANPTLRWEKTKTLNAGIDFAILHNRLSGSIDYYQKRGSDLFSDFVTDPTYGFSSLNRNTASLSGSGFDGSLSGEIVKDGKFSWNATLLFAYNKDKVTDARFAIPPGVANSPLSAGLLINFPSHYLLVYRFAGLGADGQSQVYNQKGEIKSSTDTLSGIGDLKNAGTADPRYFGSLNNSIRFGKWTLDAQISYRFGYVFLRNSIPYYFNRSTVFYSLNEDIARRWKSPGDEKTTDVPGLTNFNYTSFLRYTQSDRNVLPGGEIRLQQISLGYSFASATLARIRMRNLNVQGVVRNLGLIWRKNKVGIDPDFQIGSNGSNLRLAPIPQLNLSINANF